MRPPVHSTALLWAPLALLLTACPDEPERANPGRLWLHLDGSETMVRLLPIQPQAPF